MWRNRGLSSLCAVGGAVLLASCTPTPPKPPATPAAAPEPVPGRGIGIYKIGQPYQVNGLWYYPSADLTYDETGIAIVRPAGIHQEFTANGEVVAPADLTAAHKTLPMPTIAQVSNLDNGRSMALRINDRGPPQAGRLLELSPRAAAALEVPAGGTARIRVRVLLPETLQAQSLAKQNGGDSAAPVDPAPPAVPRIALDRQDLAPPVTGANGKKILPPPSAGASAVHAVSPAAAGTTVPFKPNPPGPVLPDIVMITQPHPTKLYVQAATYPTASAADRLKARLSSIGPVVVSAVRLHGGDQFRVRVGPLADVAVADAVLSKVQGGGMLDARIVVE